MKLSEHVHIIGSGALGSGLSNPFDCNVYVLLTGTEGVLIDAGAGIDPEALLQNLRQDGIDPEVISTLVLTHAHADHAGGAAALKELLALDVWSSPLTAELVAEGSEERLSLSDARRSGVYPPTYRFRTCRTDRFLQAGETVRVGSLSLKVLPAPGHSADMIALYCPELKALFAGDAVFEGGKLAVIETYDFCLDEYRRTIEMLVSLPIEQLYPGHGSALPLNAASAIAEAHVRFVNGEEPQSIV